MTDSSAPGEAAEGPRADDGTATLKQRETGEPASRERARPSKRHREGDDARGERRSTKDREGRDRDRGRSRDERGAHERARERDGERRSERSDRHRRKDREGEDRRRERERERDRGSEGRQRRGNADESGRSREDKQVHARSPGRSVDAAAAQGAAPSASRDKEAAAPQPPPPPPQARSGGDLEEGQIDALMEDAEREANERARDASKDAERRERRRERKERKDRHDKKKGGSAAEPPAAPAPDLSEGLTMTEIAMMQQMGIPFGFSTTQGQEVDDAAANEGSFQITSTRKARQYMNRKGGFNRALPAERTGKKMQEV